MSKNECLKFMPSIYATSATFSLNLVDGLCKQTTFIWTDSQDANNYTCLTYYMSIFVINIRAHTHTTEPRA